MRTEEKSSPAAVLEPPAETAANTVIRFPEALPGIEGAHSWELAELPEAKPFLCLRSLDRDGLRLIVADPRSFVGAYTPRFSPSALRRVEAESAESCVVLTTVTIDGTQGATINLRAPLLVNPQKMLGVQVILEDSRWPIRHDLVSGSGGAQGQGGPDHAGTEPQAR